MSGPNPSAGNVGNTLTAQAILFDSELVPALHGQTNAFFNLAVRRNQPTGAGINRKLYQYSTLGPNTSASGDGVVGSPIFVTQNQSQAQLSEWSDYSNFSGFSVAAAIDDVVGNSATELGYRAGQSLSLLYSAFFDSLVNVDANVAYSVAVAANPLTIVDVRTMKEELVALSVLPCRGTEYCGAISANVVNDLLNGTGVNASLIDWAKYDKNRSDEFEKIAAGDQMTPIRLQTTGVTFYQTPFVTQTPDFSSSKTAFRTYIAGAYAGIGVWMQVPGDVSMGDGSWQDIDCKVVKNAESSAFDPVGTIGAWSSYKFHQTITGIPVVGLNTQRLRYVDSVPAIQAA
jgi:hypothetical protein